MMSRDDMTDIAIIFGAYFLMMVVGVIFQGQPTMVFMGQTFTLIFAFVLLIMKGYAMQMIAAKYRHYYCIILPDREVTEFYVKREGAEIAEDPLNAGYQAIKMPCESVNVGDFKAVRQVVFKYSGDFDKRTRGVHTKNARFKGEKIEHQNSTVLIVERDPTVSTLLERDEPIPVFNLKYSINDEELGISNVFKEIFSEFGFSAQADIPAIVKNMALALDETRKALAASQQSESDLHTQNLLKDQILDQKRAELESFHKGAPQFKISVAHSIHSRVQDQRDLEDMGGQYGFLEKLGWWVMIPIIFAIFCIVVATNPQLLQPLGNTQTQLFIITVVALVVAGIYYLTRRKRG